MNSHSSCARRPCAGRGSSRKPASHNCSSTKTDCIFKETDMAARVPYVERENLDAEGQEIYDRIRRDRNSPTVGLQFRALLNSPKASGHLTSMGAQLRFQSAMPENPKELAIILVAREFNSAIEW